ncbi:hypothetical protein PHJA_000196900 [Phtheirospermum japonicum]|uniref:DUF641 domain-containing protein n=1 Tax=Phtheirospermum japonicum TaxID=374723 RepID=A0A830B8X1_9LAMI|nr:hypothetical protein PHJA_000196900 [Phtheirospermum japonicum]
MGFKSDKQEMEYAANSKPLKPPSNVPDMVTKSTKVSKFRSIGVFNTSKNPDDDHTYRIISGYNPPSIKDETEIHPKPDGSQSNGNAVCRHTEILKLLDLLSSMKLAYIKLQEAHIPYNPVKIRAADEQIISLLDSLRKIKKAYKEKLLKESNSVLLTEIQVRERVLEKLKSLARNKDKEIARLRRARNELETRNKKLADEVREWERESFTGLHCSSFENAVKAVGKAIHDFSKPLISLMKLSDWDLDRAASAVQESVVYAKRSHKKYVFEAYIARRMLHGFLSERGFLENVMNLDDDPIVTLMRDPHSSFAEFCRSKYLLVVHPKMEESFFGNLDHRDLVANGIHPNTQFYRAFVRMARWVWYLMGFAGFIEAKVEMFGVKQGSEFSDVYMEVVDEYKDGMDKERERYKVEFMVLPGFKLEETVIRSRVYVSKRVLCNGTH